MFTQKILQIESSVFLVCQAELYELFVQPVIVHIIGNIIRGEIGLSMSNLDHHNHNDSDQQQKYRIYTNTGNVADQTEQFRKQRTSGICSCHLHSYQ